METYIRKVNNLGQLAMRVKGSRSHQFTTETGMKIYFDAQGIPKNVLGDSPVTNLEAHILEQWTHEYYYNLVATDPITAINTIRNGTGSIILEVVGAINPGERHRHSYWRWQPRMQSNKFLEPELLHCTWYSVVDAY